jgi:hypothetical protein
MHALITVNNACYFKRMLELARRLRQDGDHVFMYLHGFRHFEAKHRVLCAEAGIQVVGSAPPTWFDILWRYSPVAEAAIALRLSRMIRSLLREHEIDVVIMPEDSPDYGGPMITGAAHAERVPVAVIAALGSAPIEELANIYMYDPELAGGSLAQRIAGRVFPEWRHRHRGKSVLRSPVGRILIQKVMRISAAQPWVYYSGHADAILVDSEEVREFCLAHGLEAKRLQVTGFVEHDGLAADLADRAAARARLDAELGLDSTKPMMLLALVQEHYISGAPTCDFQKHSDMVEFIVKTVAATKFEVVVCLHPSMSHDEFRYIEQFGVKLSRWETVKLVPLCDVYIASGSSTINWAVACGKPVINYDVYRYDLRAFAHAPAVTTLQEQSDFVAAIKRADNARERASWTERAEAAAPRWGKLDGKAYQRIRSTLSHLVNA